MMEHIIVGVDGSPHAAHALRWALDECRLRQSALTAVLTWDYLGQHHPDGSTDFDPTFDSDEANRSPAGRDHHEAFKHVVEIPVRI